MGKTSKTLTVALAELMDKLDKEGRASIDDLALQLVSDLLRNYRIHLPFGKTLEVSSVVPQKPSESQVVKLYTATYQLVDNL